MKRLATLDEPAVPPVGVPAPDDEPPTLPAVPGAPLTVLPALFLFKDLKKKRQTYNYFNVNSSVYD